MAYIGKSPSGTGVRQRYYFTATGGETSLSGTDDNGLTLSYSDGAYVDVLLNGIELVAGTDYNTSTANTIAGLAALAASDVVTVTVYDIFTVADTVSAKDGGTFSSNVTFNGNINAGTIKDATGTNTGLTVDSNGYVFTPTRPDFLAEGSASYVAYSSGDTLAYNSDNYGIQRNVGGHYSTSTYQFTAPVAGLYFFHASAYANAVVSSGLQLVHKNSGGSIQDKAIHYDTDTRSKQVTATFQMASGDTMEVQTEDAASYYLNAYGRFLGYLIG